MYQCNQLLTAFYHACIIHKMAFFVLFSECCSYRNYFIHFPIIILCLLRQVPSFQSMSTTVVLQRFVIPSNKYWCRHIFFFTNIDSGKRRKTIWMLVLLNKSYFFKIGERNVIISICLWKKYFICFDLITKIFHCAYRRNVLFHSSDGRNTSISMFWFTGAGCYI